MKHSEIWTVKSISERYNIPRPSILTAIRRGKLNAAKLSDIWMITDDEKLQNFLKRYEQKKEN